MGQDIKFLFSKEVSEKMSSQKKKKNNSRLYILIAAAILIIVFIVLIATKCTKSKTNTDSGDTSTTTQESEPTDLDPLTGLSGFTAQGKRPIAVVVNNSKPARPQWGLCTPDIVFEGVTEAGITRMLWLYSDIDKVPSKVGSMRSARHDFLEIAEGLDAVFVHWGGSKYAYAAISDRDVDDIDGRSYFGRYFFRDTERTNVAIEHRGYTTHDAINSAIDDLGIRREINSAYSSPFKFVSQKNPRTPTGGTCSRVDFVFSSYCDHSFTYSADSGLFLNNINGSPMTDADGKQMAVKNVIILYCPVSLMGDSSGCVDMDLTGGSGLYLTNGAYEYITWEKGNYNDMLKLYSSSGSELELNPGQSYIALVPSERQSSTVIS